MPQPHNHSYISSHPPSAVIVVPSARINTTNCTNFLESDIAIGLTVKQESSRTERIKIIHNIDGATAHTRVFGSEDLTVVFLVIY